MYCALTINLFTSGFSTSSWISFKPDEVVKELEQEEVDEDDDDGNEL